MSMTLTYSDRITLKKVLPVIAIAVAMLAVAGFVFFSAVKNADAAKPSDYGLTEGNTVSAAGSDDPDVYIVNDAGYKRLFLNPVIFNMYGHLGGFANVKTISAATRDAFPTSGLFRNCETNDQKVYGVETTGEDVGMLHWVNTSGAQAVADDPNFFQKVFCINTNEFNWYAKGADYTSVNQVPNYVRTPGATPTPTGSLSASLASDNPASNTLVETSVMNDLAHFNINGSGAVTTIELKRLGVSSDSTVSAVYLFVNGLRVSDAANISSGLITFNNAAGIFNAPATVSVKATIADNMAGQTIGVQLTKVNSTSVSVSGNMFSIAADSSLAAVSLSAPIGPGDFNPGVDINVWQSNFTVSTEDVYLKRLTLREIGSIDNDDVKNLRLFVDGAQISSVANLTSDGYAHFLTNTRLAQGTRVIKVVADVVGGSTRTMQFDLKGTYDVEVMDEAYGVNVAVTGSGTTEPTASTVGTPSITVVKATDSPSENVINDGKNVLLAKYTMTGYGEAIKIETLNFYLTAVDTTGDGTIDGVDNGRVYIGGSQYGSTADLLITDGTGTDYTVNYTLQPGTPVTVEVYGDIQNSTSGEDYIDATDTLKISWDAGDNNHAQGVESASAIDVPGTTGTGTATDIDANTLTVAEGSFTVGKYSGYANQTIVAPKSGYKFGHFTLTAASSEDVNMNTIDLTGTDSGGSWNEADITDAYLKVISDTGSTVLTTAVKSTLSASASNSWSVSFTLPKNKVYQVEVWGNISSTDATAGDYFNLELDAAGVTVTSGTTANAARATGQTITDQAGDLTYANGSMPAKAFVNGGTTANTFAFTLTPTYDDYTLSEVYVDIASPTVASNAGAISSLILKEGGVQIGTATLITSTGSASFTGLNRSLTQAGGTKTYTIDVVFANVGVGSNDTAGSVTMQLDGYKTTASGTTTTTDGLVPGTHTGNEFIAVKGYPTFTNATLPTTVLAAGSNVTLFKTVLSATGGQIAWNDITFTVSSNSAAATFGPAASGWKLYENGTDITSFAASDTASVSDVGTTTRVEFKMDTERAVSAGSSVTLELRTTVGGTVAANDYVSTQIANPTATTVTSEDSTTQYNKNVSFVWTDQSAPSHSTSTDDWFTDGLIKTIAESQTLTK